MPKFDYTIAVVGAGAGGLVVAIGAAKAGKKVVLIDRGTWGGDCTNFGCIPSKALIASAEAAHAVKECEELGVRLTDDSLTGHGALDRVRKIVAQVRSHEEPPQLEELGVETITGSASFVDRHTLRITSGDQVHHITAKNIVIATGSHPVTPIIDGLDSYQTNETIFDLVAIPKRLIVVGGGPIGCELAQAFSRLGSKVVLIQTNKALLMKEEPEAQRALLAAFEREGIKVMLSQEVERVSKTEGIYTVTLSNGEEINANQLLVAAGRRPSIDTLNLSGAGIAYTRRGITIDAFSRTTRKNVWAVGDCNGRALFTHVAENQGRTVLTSLLAPFKKRLDKRQAIPRCTYTSPEVASAGLLEAEALLKYGHKKIATYHIPLTTNDRAITANATGGFIKVVTRKWSSKILGATICAPRAGEMLPELTLAMLNNIPLRKLTRLIHPYPTYNGAIRAAADRWLIDTILGALRKK